MKITEIGLSHRQKIAETCLSGYVEITDKNDDYVICLEFNKCLEGDGTMFVELLSDSDDGFHSANVLKKIGPIKPDKMVTSVPICINISRETIERYICLLYKVTKGSFTSGEVTARISSDNNPWFSSYKGKHNTNK